MVHPGLKMIVKTTILGGIISAAGFVLFFLGTWGVEALRGYDFPPPWNRGLASWVYLALLTAGAGVVVGGLAGAAWHRFRAGWLDTL